MNKTKLKLLQKKVERYILRIIGMSMSISGMYFGYVWYGWKVPLVIFLSIAGNNIGRTLRRQA